MAMNSLKFSLLYSATIIITLARLFSPVLSFNHKHLSDTTRDLQYGERLGSAPPSCHNKCNQCHPCMAVQIPTLPSHNRFRPGLSRVTHKEEEYSDSVPSTASDKYSNYKPLDWKCRCGDHFFNP